MNIFLVVFTTLVTFAAADSHTTPPICMSAPAIALKPGSEVSARLESPGGKRCEATLTFTDPDFFPLRFGLRPLKCVGPQVAQFVVPPEVPNGEAHIMWRCADQPSPICTRAIITGGLSDANAINFIQSGSLSCIFPLTTLTTFRTSVGPSTTLSESVVTTVFSTGTDLPTPSEVGSIPTDGPPVSDLPAVVAPTGVTTLLSTVTDGTKTFTTSILSTLFSTPTVQDTRLPTPFTTVVPVTTETITSVSTGLSTVVTNTLTSTIFSTVVSERIPELETATGTLTPTHTCEPSAA